MDCSIDNGQTCIMFATSTTLRAGFCTAGQSALTNAVLFPVPADTQTLTIATLLAPLIQLNWQQTDLKSEIPIATTPPLASSVQISQMSSSVSLGTIIAVATIIPFVALLLLGTALWCSRRRRRRASSMKKVITIGRPISTERHMFRKQPQVLVQLHEAPDNFSGNELEASSAPKELSARGSRVLYELMGSECGEKSLAKPYA